MPIYEYYCSDCKLRFEKLRPLARSQEGVSCPRCQQEAGRVPSAFASFSKSESGASRSLAGSGCAGCGATSCSTCGS